MSVNEENEPKTRAASEILEQLTLATKLNAQRETPYFQGYIDALRFSLGIDKKGWKMKITKREVEIIKLIHLTRNEIAKKLYISRATVNTHVRNLCEKFKSKTKIEILIKALRSNIITIQDVDIGFWNENDVYVEKIVKVDFSKE